MSLCKICFNRFLTVIQYNCVVSESIVAGNKPEYEENTKTAGSLKKF